MVVTLGQQYHVAEKPTVMHNMAYSLKHKEHHDVITDEEWYIFVLQVKSIEQSIMPNEDRLFDRG